MKETEENNGEYYFEIGYAGNRVLATIRRTIGNSHVWGDFVKNKTFGKWWREAKEEDYKEAREWAKKYIKIIIDANKQ